MSALLDFLFPTSCVVCGRPPSLVCVSCLPEGSPRSEMLGGYSLHFSLDLEGAAESLVTGYKDQMKLALARRLSGYLDAAVSDLEQPPEFLVYPPSTKSNFARRGFNPVELVCKKSLVLHGAKVLPVARKKQTRDQRSLAATERRANLLGAFEIQPGRGDVLIVDDVVTTGATVLSLAAALRHAGFRVSGICAIARRNQSRDALESKKA